MSAGSKLTTVELAVADAIEQSAFTYELKLTRLDDGAERYAYVADLRRKRQAQAVMSALSKVVQIPDADDVGRLLKAAEYIRPYLEFTIGDESPYHHPTMPSAVAAFMASVNEIRDRRLAASTGD